ncbi:MAG: 4-demethylwyosine synthase TYW1 [Candidatus Woesearchaeota archaeon]
MPFTDKEKKILENKQYGLFGNHSSVQICEWTKNSLRKTGTCYKDKFYGVNTHKCAQITPTTLLCNHRCNYCWRPTEDMKKTKEEWDNPEEIIKGLIEKRKMLLSGFKGRKGMDEEFFNDSLIPDHFAISLSGEPTLYPKIDELIKYLKKDYKARTIFLVTNASQTEKLKEISRNPPTQLYFSINTYNKELFHKITPIGSFESIKESLKNIPQMNTRTVIRVTLIKGFNDKDPKKFAQFLDQYDADFIEVKSYMWIGNSRDRLVKKNMPTHEYTKNFSEKLVRNMKKYKIEDEHKRSRIVLLKNINSKYDTIIDVK